MQKILLICFCILGIYTNISAQSEYVKLKNSIENKRQEVYKKYEIADSLQRDSLLKVSYNFLYKKLLDDVFPAWYGTRWEFHGHTKVPQQGAIACGYFVTTTLQDVGFKIPRVKWAQMVSERIIRKLASDVKRFHNAKIEDVVKYINNKGDGLYIVGLDQHVGFISKQNNKLRFIHANYYHPETGVMEEPLVGWNPLSHSKYRVIGKILNITMVENWIKGYEYE